MAASWGAGIRTVAAVVAAECVAAECVAHGGWTQAGVERFSPAGIDVFSASWPAGCTIERLGLDGRFWTEDHGLDLIDRASKGYDVSEHLDVPWRPDPTTRTAVLSDAVRRRRESLGLRQEDLADLAGCSERFVHTVEVGKTSLRLDKLLDVLGTLGLTLVVDSGNGSVRLAPGVAGLTADGPGPGAAGGPT